MLCKILLPCKDLTWTPKQFQWPKFFIGSLFVTHWKWEKITTFLLVMKICNQCNNIFNSCKYILQITVRAVTKIHNFSRLSPSPLSLMRKKRSKRTSMDPSHHRTRNIAPGCPRKNGSGHSILHKFVKLNRSQFFEFPVYDAVTKYLQNSTG